MKIVNKREDKMVEFSSIKEGEVFTTISKNVCMKIKPVYNASDDIFYNIVNLATGELDFSSDRFFVYLIECELVIE